MKSYPYQTIGEFHKAQAARRAKRRDAIFRIVVLISLLVWVAGRLVPHRPVAVTQICVCRTGPAEPNQLSIPPNGSSR